MNNRMITIIALLIIACAYGQALNAATLEEKISSFFDKYNVSSNSSSPELIHSELGVHYLGGGATTRTNVVDISPIHVGMPKFSAGCGGIDYTLGGINIASKEEMKNALKSIASNGVGYAFLLGIETVSPIVASTMKQIQTWANQLNAININSCEIASSLVQGAWPKTATASSYICEHAATTNPLFKDLIEAKHGCRDDPDKKKAAYQRVINQDKDVFVGNYNVAWKVLEKSSLDEEMKTLFLNITGTIVVKGEKEIKVFPPQHKKATNILRLGGSIEQGYHIADNGIDIEIRPLTINPKSSWKSKIYKTLSSLQNKLLQERQGKGSELSESERNLITTTRFPIGSLLSLMAQYNRRGGALAIDRYSDLIAYERVLDFAQEIVRDTLFRAESLRSAQINGYELNEYIDQINEVLQDLKTINSENLQHISSEHQIINYLMNVDRTLREKERGV